MKYALKGRVKEPKPRDVSKVKGYPIRFHDEWFARVNAIRVKRLKEEKK